MVFGLGAAWILDGQLITFPSSVTGVFTRPQTLDRNPDAGASGALTR